MDCSIIEFGAKADGVTVNTDAIQKTVDFVSEHGGGKVVIPKGIFMSGTIRLRDHIELHLEDGAVLKGSSDLSHYNEFEEYPQNFQSEREGWSGKHLILAVEKEDVSITGKGTICGNSEAFFDEPHRCKSFNYFWSRGIAKAINGQRPGQMIAFVECKNLRFLDFHIEDSPCWSLLLHGCEKVQVKGLTIRSPLDHANTDGVDVDTCLDVSVSECDIDTGDDAIAIRCNGKNLQNGRTVCENVRVENCRLASSACGIRVGVGRGEIRNVVCKNLTITRAGSAIELMTAYRKNGDANQYDLRFEKIRATNVSYPFRFSQWNESEISNVVISDFSAQCYCAAVFESEAPQKIQNVTIRDFSMEILPAPFLLDERAPSERGEYALSVHGVRGLVLENINAAISKPCKDEWLGLYRVTESENVTKNNCNF